MNDKTLAIVAFIVAIIAAVIIFKNLKNINATIEATK
jgi:hypothetical protein